MNASPAKLISQTPHLSVDGSGRLRVEAVGETDAICPPRVDASAREDACARLAIAGPNQCNKAVSESVFQRDDPARAAPIEDFRALAAEQLPRLYSVAR